MKKIIFRTFALLLVFAAAFLFYYSTIDEHTDVDEEMRTSAISSSLPLMSFSVSGNEINLTRGHTVLWDDHYTRESITPLSTDQEFSIYIKQKGRKVKKIMVDVLDIPALSVLEEQDNVAFSTGDDGRIVSSVKLENALPLDTEYMLRVTITDGEGKKIYYYTRLLPVDYGSLSGSMEFLKHFHETTFDKDNIYELEGYMEPEENVHNTDFSHVDIHDNLDTLSYGEMSPEQIYSYVPTITEYNEKFIGAAMYFWIQAYSDRGLETYQCREGYRFRYFEDDCVLLSYDRTMDAVFTGAFSDGKNHQFKLGILNSKDDLKKKYDEDYEQLLFSFQGTLWHLDIKKNTLVNVLSYRTENDYDSVPDPQYDFKVLNVKKNGDADFIVYGQIGKGAYEGRSGIIYYRYYAAEKRIEEKMFIPVNMEFVDLKDAFGKVAYATDNNSFVFSLLDSLYSYELDTNVLRVLLSGLGENWVYFEDKKLVVFNEKPFLESNKQIVIYNLENGNKAYINADSDYAMNMLGTVDGKIVFGDANPYLVSFFDDGSTLIPYVNIQINDFTGRNVKKENPGANKYYGRISFEPGYIAMDIYTLASSREENRKAVFTYESKDVIIDLYDEEEEYKPYVSEYDSTRRTEYYMNVPSDYEAERPPVKSGTINTVITNDTAAAVPYEKAEKYYTYSYGKILASAENPGELIDLASDKAGCVVDSNGDIMWKRGRTEEEDSVDDLEFYETGEKYNARQAVIQTLIDYYGVGGDAGDFDMAEKPMYEWLKDKFGENVAAVKNVSLENMLYYVSNDMPVIVSCNGHYGVIYAYSDANIRYYDPVSDEREFESKEDAKNIFEASGGLYFVVY